MKILEKLQKRLQEGKKDNKGFSLVELIIVIAIMAILIGIVGMNVIPQIENSRKATDEQVLSALCTEAMEAYTQAAYGVGDYTVTFTVSANGAVSSASVAVTSGGNGTEDDADKIEALMNELGSTSRTLKSNAGKALASTTTDDDDTTSAAGITIILTDDTNAVPVTLTAAGFNEITVR